jgi:hypothetical protein
MCKEGIDTHALLDISLLATYHHFDKPQILENIYGHPHVTIGLILMRGINDEYNMLCIYLGLKAIILKSKKRDCEIYPLTTFPTVRVCCES